MPASQSLLQLAQNAGLSMSMRGAVEAMLVQDELTPLLPFDTIAGTRAYAYDRKLGNVAASWVAADAALSSAGGLKFGRVMSETKKFYAQPNISPEDAARLGGANDAMGELSASAFIAMSRAIGDKAINGNSAPTATIDAQSPLVASTCITAVTCGGMIDPALGLRGELKYTATGTLFRYKAPGDTDFGDAVTIGTSTTATVFSKNGDSWLRITRGVGSLSSNTTAVVTLALGADEPDGIYTLMAAVTRQWLYGGTDGGAITFSLLDQLIDLIKGNGQKVLLTSKPIRRAIRDLIRNKASSETFADVGARKVLAYDGIPIIVSDYMPTNRARGSSGSVCSSIIGMTLGDMQGFRGVASTGIVDIAMQGARAIAQGPYGIGAYQLPVTTTSDTLTTRATGYVGFAQELVEGVAILDGLTY